MWVNPAFPAANCSKLIGLLAGSLMPSSVVTESPLMSAQPGLLALALPATTRPASRMSAQVAASSMLPRSRAHAADVIRVLSSDSDERRTPCPTGGLVSAGDTLPIAREKQP